MWRGQKVIITPDAALTQAVEPKMSNAIIVSAHVELCPIKYSNLWAIWPGFLVMCYSYM